MKAPTVAAVKAAQSLLAVQRVRLHERQGVVTQRLSAIPQYLADSTMQNHDDKLDQIRFQRATTQ
jgi:hypothetical protein